MRIISLLAVLILSITSTICTASSISYITDGFDKAKLEAQSQGKMLLVDFYASWCVPCKWMDETTFSDPSVIEKMNNDYVSVKINIDDFDGYALKELYAVKVLPTVIIINNDGKVVERIEETLPPSKMNVVLDKNKGTKKDYVHTPNTDPIDIGYTTTKSDPRENVGNYKLQLGTFTSYASTLKFYNNVATTIDEQIIILHDYKGDNTIYRVLMGNFKNTTEAEIYKTELMENYNITSYLYY